MFVFPDDPANHDGTLATCEAVHEALDETNLDLQVECRLLKIQTGE